MTNDQLDQFIQEAIHQQNEVALNACLEERTARIEKAQAKLRDANMSTSEARLEARDMAQAYMRDARPSLPPSTIKRICVEGTRAAVEIQTLSTGHTRVIMVRFASDKYGEKVSHRGGTLTDAQDFLSKAQ